MSTETTTVEIPEGFTDAQTERLLAIYNATEARKNNVGRQNAASTASAEVLRALSNLDKLPPSIVTSDEAISTQVAEVKTTVHALAQYFADIASQAGDGMMAQKDAGWLTAAITMAEAGDIEWSDEQVAFAREVLSEYESTPLPKNILANSVGSSSRRRPIEWTCILCGDGKVHGESAPGALGTSLRNHLAEKHPDVAISNNARLMPGRTIQDKLPGWDGDLFVVDTSGSNVVKVNSTQVPTKASAEA